MVCNERARELGVDAEDLNALAVKLEARLGAAWPRFQAWMRDLE
jgi:hypothetical protein